MQTLCSIDKEYLFFYNKRTYKIVFALQTHARRSASCNAMKKYARFIV